MNFNTSLAAGVLAAVLGAIAAGELFAAGSQSILSTGLSSVSLLLLAVSFPFLFRFFVRTMLGYQNLLRFNRIQRYAWHYLTGERSWEAFVFLERKFGSVEPGNWRSPASLRRLEFSNLEYGYFWIVSALLIPLVWALTTHWDDERVRNASLAIIGGALLWELTVFFLHRRHFFQTLTSEEEEMLQELERLPGDVRSGDVCPTLIESSLVEEARGLFVGRRILRRR